MTVSNSTDFNQTRDQIIADALMSLGVYRPGATVTANDTTICSNWLNKIIKSIVARGIHMWAETEGTLFLRNGVNQYTIAGSDNVGDNVIETTLTTGSGTALTVASTAGMTAADNIGIELDNNTRQWTTIVSVDSSTTLTITAGLTSAASSGRTVFSYTTTSSKALYVSSVRNRTSDGIDLPINLRGRDEFMMISNKASTGTNINQCFYVPNLTTGTMYVWPTPNNCASRLKFSYQRVLNDFDSSGDTPDVPSEWLECLTVLLKWRIAPTYGKNIQEQAMLQKEANDMLLEMNLWDINSGSIFIQPNLDE